MADKIGAIGSQDDLFSRIKKFMFTNPAEKSNHTAKGAFVATLDDFTKSGNVPGYSDVSIHTQTSYS